MAERETTAASQQRTAETGAGQFLAGDITESHLQYVEGSGIATLGVEEGGLFGFIAATDLRTYCTPEKLLRTCNFKQKKEGCIGRTFLHLSTHLECPPDPKSYEDPNRQ